MSTGGLFSLVANDGRADKMVLATQLLQKRICDIRCAKHEQGFQNTDPTLAEIEKTHILFVNTHIKPFVQCAFEYQRENNVSGSLAWGSEVKFSIPQAGDFFHDMVVNLTTNKLKGLTGTVPDLPDSITTDNVDSKYGGTQTTADETNDNGDTIRRVTIIDHRNTDTTTTEPALRVTQEYVDASGSTLVPGSNISSYVRWVEWPGIKAFRNVKIEIGNSPLDEYTQDAVLFHEIYNVSEDKQEGFKKLMCQDVAYEAISNYSTTNGNSNYFDFASNSDITGSAPKAGNSSQMLTTVKTGYQTPDKEKPGLNVWHPLLFWFNKNIGLAIPSISIPYGQRFIYVQLEEFEKMAQEAYGNLFLKTTTEEFSVSVAGTNDGGDLSSGTVEEVNVAVRHDPRKVKNGGVDSDSGSVKNMYLWISNIYVLPEIHDIFVERIGFYLIRLYKKHTATLSSSSDEESAGEELKQLKFPVEYMQVGFQPQENYSTKSDSYWMSWHRFTDLQKEEIDVVSSGSSIGAPDNTDVRVRQQNHVNTYTYWKENTTVSKLGVTSQGIEIFRDIDQKFWNAYIPYHFGSGNMLQTPKKNGTYFISFCFYPNHNQPSGHLNLSRVQRTYLNYVSQYISDTKRVRLVVVASAINFLIISDGTASLRYGT